MNCAEANQLDMVQWPSQQGFQSQKIRGADHWYLSPFRDEKDASFKVNRNKNVLYDHGLGKGGKLVDFVVEFYHCNTTSEALQKIVSFHQKKMQIANLKPPLKVPEKDKKNVPLEDENRIIIIGVKHPIADINLCRYAAKRKIGRDILNEWCSEIFFSLNNKGYKAIGFKNNAGAYELRNEYFKGSSSPKFISYTDNNSKSTTVFEGFFDLLSYQTFNRGKEQALTNFLVLNSLAFFERSLLLMEKHERIKLCLDNDDAGKKHVALALKRSPKFEDGSKLYKGCEDLNEWLAQTVKQSQGLGIRRHL
jgi:hypothetical protein